jgi:hypothetical protein
MPKYFKFDKNIIKDEEKFLNGLNRLVSKIRLLEKKLNFNLEYGIKPDPVPDFYTLSNSVFIEDEDKM